MPRSPGIDGWLQIARMTALAGDMAPFPYIKGAAGCVVAILEAIEVRFLDLRGAVHR